MSISSVLHYTSAIGSQKVSVVFMYVIEVIATVAVESAKLSRMATQPAIARAITARSVFFYIGFLSRSKGYQAFLKTFHLYSSDHAIRWIWRVTMIAKSFPGDDGLNPSDIENALTV